MVCGHAVSHAVHAHQCPRSRAAFAWQVHRKKLHAHTIERQRQTELHAAEVERRHRFSRRAAAMLLSAGLNARRVGSCTNALLNWRSAVAFLSQRVRERATASLLFVARMGGNVLPFGRHDACVRALLTWRAAAEAVTADMAMELALEGRAAQLHDARAQIGSLRARAAPLRLEADMQQVKDALVEERAKNREMASQITISQRAHEAAKAQHESVSRELRRTAAQLRASQKELARRATSADASVQVSLPTPCACP